MNSFLPLTLLMLILNLVLGSDEVTNDEFTDGDAGTDPLHRTRRGISMLRLGRGLQMLRLGKRALPMLRLGRSAADSSLSQDDLQYLLSLIRSESKKQVPLPRYGKDLDFQYMLMNALWNAEQQGQLYSGEDDSEEARFPGYRYDFGGLPNRQLRPIPRPGRYKRSADMPAVETASKQASDKSAAELGLAMRVAPLSRYGKEEKFAGETDYPYLSQEEKRAMRMLRLGRGMRMLRLGKRPYDDDDQEQVEEEGDIEADKRALRLLRLGKRPGYNMLRLGRGGNTGEEKRALRLLRLGKRMDDDQDS